jgi:4'-phosphopantetheinyl transferase
MPPVSRETIHLRTHRLDVPAHRLAAFSRLLAPDEQARAARFRFEVHRNRYIAGRGRLREILSYYLDADPAGLVFTANQYGKPGVDGTDLRFNVSHTEDLAVYAIARGREVGVDIERIRPLAAEGIPERFFSPAEVAALRSLPRDLQPRAFFNCWTRKEAYVKASGEGLSIPLNSFDVTLLPGEPARFLRNGEGWSMEAFQREPDYIGAVVAEGSGWELVEL